MLHFVLELELYRETKLVMKAVFSVCWLASFSAASCMIETEVAHTVM